jgi:transposase InsO family protein
VYLRRPATRRNEAWEADHKQLPALVAPPRGPAVRPWMTTVIDDGTRTLVGWALSVVPHTGTVVTALRMALVADPVRGPFGAVPALVRIDRGLDFAAAVVGDALAALCVTRTGCRGTRLLRSRIFRRVPFKPFAREQVPALMRGYHRYADAEEKLLCSTSATRVGLRDGT